jgi:hypothetical protein
MDTERREKTSFDKSADYYYVKRLDESRTLILKTLIITPITIHIDL